MKKRLIAIISLIISLFVCIGVSGCDLVTTNTEKDMAQVIATVNIGEDRGYYGETEEIYKKEMIIAYMQYGYYYAQQGSYSNTELFGAIVDNLINERILVQTAKAEVKKANSLTISDWSKAEQFISDDDKLEAKYYAVSSIKSLVDGYREKAETYQDASDEEERTVPTDATNYSEAFEDIDDVESAINEMKIGIQGETGSKQMIAYNKVIKLLEVNELLGDEFKDNDIFTSYYYSYLLEAQYESKLVAEYEKLLLGNKIEAELNNLSYQALSDYFNDLYNSQKALYENDIQGYKTALGSATKTAPIVYASTDAQENVGYVWNLLIGATDEQTEAINNIDSTNKTKDEVAEERENILKDNIVMKDQRSSWITSGYDCLFIEDGYTFNGEVEAVDTVRFVNDYTYLGDNGLVFQGEVQWLNKGEYEQTYTTNADGKFIIKYTLNGVVDEDYEPEFRVVRVDEVVGKDNIKTTIETLYSNLGSNNDAINELLMAFSTDSGSLNSFKGYVVLKDDASSSWVKEFQKVGAELVSDNELGKMSIATTDYGYHFMFNNGLVKDYASLDDYCEAFDDDKYGEVYFGYLMENWDNLKDADKDTYMYYLANTYLENIVSTYESDFEREIINSSKVEKFESRYADLVGEDEE